MVRTSRTISIAIGFAIAVLTLSTAFSIAVLTLEPFGTAVSDLFSRTTGIPTVYAARDETQKQLAAAENNRLHLIVKLAESEAREQECANSKNELKTELRDYLTLNDERSLQLAMAARTARLIHLGINLGLSRHLQSAPLKAVPTLGTSVVMALTVTELGHMCVQHDQVNKLMLSIDAEHESLEKPLVCKLGPEALGNFVHDRIFRESRQFNWREECLEAESQGTTSLGCDRFPAEGPIDPDAWINAAGAVEFLVPVDPDDWIRQDPNRDILPPVDPDL
jgi:hypothetical protein